MGLSNTQYRDIMYKYDQLRLKNKRIVAARYEKLFNKIPKLKEIQNEIINLSTNQARMELLSTKKFHACLICGKIDDFILNFLKFWNFVKKLFISCCNNAFVF